jgi:hypothetical protein
MCQNLPIVSTTFEYVVFQAEFVFNNIFEQRISKFRIYLDASGTNFSLWTKFRPVWLHLFCRKTELTFLEGIRKHDREQGCQMVYFQTKNPNLDKFWRALERKLLVYFMPIYGYCYVLWSFGNFVAIWYIFPRFGILCQ